MQRSAEIDPRIFFCIIIYCYHVAGHISLIGISVIFYNVLVIKLIIIRFVII